MNAPVSIHHQALRVRQSEPRDGVNMWRVARDTGLVNSASPFLFMTMARRCRGCLVAERGGEAVGFLIAEPPSKPEAGEAARVIELAVAPQEDELEVALELLSALSEMPAFASAGSIELPASASRSLRWRFARLASLERPKRLCGSLAALAL